MSALQANVEAASAAVGTLVLVAGTYLTVRTSAKSRADAAAVDRAHYGAQQFEAGARSRDDEVALLRSAHEAEVRQLRNERDDARAERREALADAREWRRQALQQGKDG